MSQDVFGPGTVVAKNVAFTADPEFGPGTVVAKNSTFTAELVGV